MQTSRNTASFGDLSLHFLMTVLALVCAAPLHSAESALPPACDQGCLGRFIDRYFEALSARNPAALTWAPHARFSENNVMLPIGDGLWQTVTGPAKGVLKFTDPQAGAAGALALVEQHHRPAYFALRLKIRDGAIVEAETQINQPAEGAVPSPAAGDPSKYFHYPEMSASIAPADRTPRRRMVDLANGYFSTLQLNDGVLLTNFSPTCRRQENGFESTANPQFNRPEGKLYCAEQFKTGNFRFDSAVRDRDYVVVDEEHGLVLARAFIDHDASRSEYLLADGRRVVSPIKKPESLSMLELFHIGHGMIDRVEVVHVTVPYGMPSVWRRCDEP